MTPTGRAGRARGRTSASRASPRRRRHPVDLRIAQAPRGCPSSPDPRTTRARTPRARGRSGSRSDRFQSECSSTISSIRSPTASRTLRNGSMPLRRSSSEIDWPPGRLGVRVERPDLHAGDALLEQALGERACVGQEPVEVPEVATARSIRSTVPASAPGLSPDGRKTHVPGSAVGSRADRADLTISTSDVDRPALPACRRRGRSHTCAMPFNVTAAPCLTSATRVSLTSSPSLQPSRARQPANPWKDVGIGPIRRKVSCVE